MMKTTNTLAAIAAAAAFLIGCSLLDGPSEVQAAQDTELAAQDAAYAAQLMAAEARRDTEFTQAQGRIEADLTAELAKHSDGWTPEEKARAANAAHIAALLSAAEQIPPATR